MKNQSINLNDVSTSFVAQHLEDITAVLQCWDRLRFMASVSLLQRPAGVMMWLYQVGVLLKNFAEWSKACTERLREHSLGLARAAGQTAVLYLRDGSVRKDELARAQAQARGIKEGLIGVWSALEPCSTYFVRGGGARGLRLVREPGKCLHYYFYFLHRQLGLLHVRLQSWLPYTATVCLNGHDWLARQMDAAGLGYERRGNAFTWLENPAAAQALAETQTQCAWPALLDGLLAQCHPLLQLLCEPVDQAYYWSLKESEFSTDLLFRSETALARLYPRLLHFGMAHFGSREILRFLGKRVPAEGCPANFHGEAQSNLRGRPEGVRIKHFVAGNSVKMYDKEASILRVETTINRPKEFRVFRESSSSGSQPSWRPMRKGIADLHRRREVSRAANERCLEAYAAVPLARSTGEVADTIFRPVRVDGRRFRALQPWSPKDGPLLAVLNDGDWLLNGLRNRDLRARLYPGQHPAEEQKKLGARVSRLLRLLRAHHLIQKRPKTHRYQVTPRGREIIAALQTARQTNLDELLKIAA